MKEGVKKGDEREHERENENPETRDTTNRKGVPIAIAVARALNCVEASASVAL